MDNQPAFKLRFKPRRFWRHDLTGVGYIHKTLDSSWIKRECRLPYIAGCAALEFCQAADASNKIDILIRALIDNVKERREYKVLQNAHIETCNRIVGIYFLEQIRICTQ